MKKIDCLESYSLNANQAAYHITNKSGGIGDFKILKMLVELINTL